MFSSFISNESLISICLQGARLLSGGCVGATIWFFFIQSPILFRLLGRQKFVPIMMRLTRAYSSAIFTATVLEAALASISYIQLIREQTKLDMFFGFSMGALVAVSLNYFLVIPIALAAGRASVAERAKEDTNSISDFVVEGGSKTETKTKHQTVVAFVLTHTVMLVCVIFCLPSF